MASHDITFVGIVQTAKASGMEQFPIPYVLTNCHNTLCAVGGTINEDDHMFGLSAAKKYGGIYVPPHIAVIHQYMRERMAGCGKMILGSDSHTRYGALGTMAIGEGGGELVKQLLRDTYDVAYPGVIAVYLDGCPKPGTGPQDIALAIIRAVFKNGYVKNKVMEFVGPGVASMTTDYRNGVDVMTTETTCLTSIWRTDEDTRNYLAKHHREADYKKLDPADVAYYDGCVYVDLSTVKPMIALPFHPSNAFEIDELKANMKDILHMVEMDAEKVSGGKAHFTLLDKVVGNDLMVQQGIIAGCAGGNYSNVIEAAHALRGKNCGCDEFSLAVYPSSQPVFSDLVKKGAISDLMDAGAIIRTAFCGPCFGAGDTPCNNGLSIRHTTRNFPNREGSKPGNGQMAAVALMDARLLKRWVVFPLKDEKPVNERLDVVEYFFRKPDFKEFIEEKLHLIGDLERIVSKAAVGRISPREVVQLKVALQAIEPIKNACLNADNGSLRRIGEQLNICLSIREKIAKEVKNDPPLLVNKGGVIADGVNAELDELRQIAFSGKDYLLKVQQRESELTGIPSLKIAYNNVFGYYIEVRNTHKDKVPADWIRKQTLVNAERYITQELKEYEEKILGAEDKILVLETKLYNELVIALAEFIPAIQINASQIARLDCLLAFANVAKENNYIRPVVEDSEVIDIRQGRHPVIEKQLPVGEKYIANDVFLDSETQQIIIITGPNMAGKSALLRQTALITLLAQMGSFVPAESARIGMVDKIFTRVGASDNISVGESTFMVEMNEAANILNNLSSRSLVLFDELGRGTSTYDGISIAWAIVEHIHEHPKAKARTLFATHYHELNEMEKSFKRIKNYNVSVKEIDNKVIFLRKLERGGSEHSFGIHVAKMAGMPKSIVKRANDILHQLETDNRQQGIAKPTAEIASGRSGMQLSFFQLDDPVLSQIRDEILNLDVNNLTPLEALNKLNDIKKIVKGK